jgi:peroxiredoxin
VLTGRKCNPLAQAFNRNNSSQKERTIRMRRYTTRILGIIAVAASFGTGANALAADPGARSLEGRWEATLTTKAGVVPFRLDISGEGAGLKGTLYNGWDPFETTTSARFENGTLVLNIEHYLTKITANLKDDALEGQVVAQSRTEGATYEFHAKRYVAPAASVNAPSVSGSWEIPLDKPNAKGEKTQRLIVLQRGAEISASILRVDGDTGALNGTYKDGKWVLGHFDGSRPAVMELALTKDGSLEIKQEGGRAGDKSIAIREEVARAKGVAEPEDYTTHTTMRNPDEVFTYKFPDVDGKVVSNDDPKFKGKVVLAIVTGTWCPNCHDEAQYLVQLYAKYHDRGLEIVALDFEEPEQQDELTRVHAFIKQYKVPYTYLIAGAPAEMWEKIPQAVNLNTWPATLFVGRDGKVKHIHTGFASPASGLFNQQLQQEFTAKIEELLKEKARSAGVSAE